MWRWRRAPRSAAGAEGPSQGGLAFRTMTTPGAMAGGCGGTPGAAAGQERWWFAGRRGSGPARLPEQTRVARSAAPGRLRRACAGARSRKVCSQAPPHRRRWWDHPDSGRLLPAEADRPLGGAGVDDSALLGDLYEALEDKLTGSSADGLHERSPRILGELPGHLRGSRRRSRLACAQQL